MIVSVVIAIGLIAALVGILLGNTAVGLLGIVCALVARIIQANIHHTETMQVLGLMTRELKKE